MSQHIFRTEHGGHPVEVVLGFDRSMGHFFMVVTRTGNRTPLYNNLQEPDAFDKDLPYFRAKLAELGITTPNSLFDEVTIDQRMGAGNRRVLHAADGTFTSL